MCGVRQGPDFTIFSVDAHLSPNQFCKSKPPPYGLKAVSEDACVSLSSCVPGVNLSIFLPNAYCFNEYSLLKHVSATQNTP